MTPPRLYYKHNRLQQLRGFCYAAQAISISKAAERMHLSQPSVSLQIQALEKELQVTLFERRGPSIRLTPEGETLYQLALPLVEGFDNLPETFATLRGDLESGDISIAAGESTILYLLPESLQRFSQTYPGIRIRFHNVPGRHGVQLLRDDDVDFAVGSNPEVDDMAYYPIHAFDQVLITPPAHPLARQSRVSLADISPYEFILPPRAFNTLGMVELVFQQHNLKLNVKLEAGGWEIIKKYVAMGLGISIVSGICLTGQEPLTVHQMGDYFPRRTYGIVMRRGKFLSPQARRFIEFIDPQLLTPSATWQ